MNSKGYKTVLLLGLLIVLYELCVISNLDLDNLDLKPIPYLRCSNYSWNGIECHGL